MSWVFEPAAVAAAPLDELWEALLEPRIALQPNRRPQIWWRNAQSIAALGGVRAIAETQGWNLAAMTEFVPARRSEFPYLCGPKIVNYWLYVLSQYLTWPLTGGERLTVAPDRHVIEASRHLGLVPMAGSASHAAPLAVAESWRELLDGTEPSPIDLHTPALALESAGSPRSGDAWGLCGRQS